MKLAEKLTQLETYINETIIYVLNNFGQETQIGEEVKNCVPIPEENQFYFSGSISKESCKPAKYITSTFKAVTEEGKGFDFMSIDIKTRCQIADTLLFTYTGQ